MILIAEEPVMNAAVAVALPNVPRVAAVVKLAHSRRVFQALETYIITAKRLAFRTTNSYYEINTILEHLRVAPAARG
jgi:hypothetical protein